MEERKVEEYRRIRYSHLLTCILLFSALINIGAMLFTSLLTGFAWLVFLLEIIHR